MNELKEKLLSAINNIDFDNMCKNRKSTLEKALVMLRTEWDIGDAVNLRIDNGRTEDPTWNWAWLTYTIAKPKRNRIFGFFQC